MIRELYADLAKNNGARLHNIESYQPLNSEYYDKVKYSIPLNGAAEWRNQQAAIDLLRKWYGQDDLYEQYLDMRRNQR